MLTKSPDEQGNKFKSKLSGEKKKKRTTTMLQKWPDEKTPAAVPVTKA